MAKFNDPLCNDCPYQSQKHLASSYYNQGGSPLSIDTGRNTDTLIVFLAPGEEEWKACKPLQPTIKKGGTAGSRVEQSWKRKNRKRLDFDITNSVQCFPGKSIDGRDEEPSVVAICKCYKWLKQDIEKKEYVKIIAFGKVAQQQVGRALNELNRDILVVKLNHPTGGLTRAQLDSAWD